MKPSKHQSSKQRGQDGGWNVHDRSYFFFFTHTLCMNFVIAVFLLVSSMNTQNHLLYFARFCAPKMANKKPTTKNFAGFHNHLPLLPMIYYNRWPRGGHF